MQVNFGDVSIPRDFEVPKPAQVAPLRGVHAVSSEPIVVVDAQTLLVPSFSYDGEAPGMYLLDPLWAIKVSHKQNFSNFGRSNERCVTIKPA